MNTTTTAHRLHYTRLLKAYTRPIGDEAHANNADIALSVHLALRNVVSGEWQPLFDNYGIIFAAGTGLSGIPQKASQALQAGKYVKADPWQSPSAHPSAAPSDNSSMPGVDLELKSLRSPFLFRYDQAGDVRAADDVCAAGGVCQAGDAPHFALLATRTQRGGEPDGSERSAALLITSPDLLSYTQQGMLHFDTTAGVHNPQAQWQSDSWLLTFADDEGKLWQSHVADVVQAARNRELLPVEPCTSHRFPLINTADEESVSFVPLTGQEAGLLEARFGHISNVASQVSSLDVSRLSAPQALQALQNHRALLSYSDGTQCERAVEWDDLDAFARAMEKAAHDQCDEAERTIEVTGRVKRMTLPTPFAVQRADPSIVSITYGPHNKKMYVFIATDDTDGNCIDPHEGRTHMPARFAHHIADLADANGGLHCEVNLLKAGDKNSLGQVMTGCFWAPEIHEINGVVSILFMPCFAAPTHPDDGLPHPEPGKADMWTGCSHIMQLKKENGYNCDPSDPQNWTVPEPIVRADGSPLNLIQHISLDMTVCHDSGNWYYIWQQVGSIWAARFNPEHPATLISEPRQIICPEFAWDNMIDEGPNVIEHDGTLFLIFSGSAVGPTYTTGLAMAPAGKSADLCDPATWRKLDYPVQKSSIFNSRWQLGTGHGMWSYDEDGELIYVFHAAEYDNGHYNGRDALVRHVHWSGLGLPVLDMSDKEDVDPRCEQVTCRVRIR